MDFSSLENISFLTNFVEKNQLLIYFILFLGIILEGEIILIFTGIITQMGLMDIYFCIPIIFLSLITKMFLTYNLGLFLRKEFFESKISKYLIRKIDYFFPFFYKKTFLSIFLSKFLVGINNVVLIFSGYQRINFKTFAKADILANLIWAPLILFLGYFTSLTFALSVIKETKKFVFYILLAIIIFFVLEKILTFVFNFIKIYFINNFSNKHQE